jgi:hypothetical protein
MSENYETTIWEEEPGSVTYSLMLGDDYDCDTCGVTYNEAELEIDDESLTFSYRVGCYGGESARISEKDFDSTLEKMFGVLNNFPNWNKEFENKVKEEVNNWYTMSAIKEIRDWKIGK